VTGREAFARGLSIMESISISRRTLLVGLAGVMTCPVLGCGSGSDSEKPAEIKQEANTKSLQASGDFYKQQHQQKKK
jgi:hypothetical protein